MAVSVDQLQIQITADATRANNALDRLTRNLNTLSVSLNRLNGRSLSGMSNIATQSNAISSATGNLVTNMNRTHTAMQRATKSTTSLAAAFGKFYANYFLVVRGLKALWGSIKSTTDYIEAFNYYTVAFGKISSEWKDDWSKYGYENGEAYAESFTERMSESLEKMSGIKIEIDDSGMGMLTDTGMKNLGLNIQEVTQYASQLASVTNSVGQTGETSLAAASAFTKLGADISSLFNIDYSSVMGNLQSGLIGQSRALYKYGIDITNATLQTYAYELGLSKAVSEMTQAEKMQLRMIAILDQSKVSWGDLANTINSPSNMIRQFKNNLKETGMVLGQLFIPMLNNVLPALNGITIALKKTFTEIANFFGIKINTNQFGQGYTETEETLDGISGGYEEATKAAKKYENQVLGFDEVTKLTEPSDSSSDNGAVGSGIDLTSEILKATSEYEKAWNNDFKRMENRSEKFAKRVTKALKPVKKLFKDLSIGDYFAVGQDVSDIVVGINKFFTKAIKNVDWKKIGKNIGKFLEGIDWMKIISSALVLKFSLAKAIADVWFSSFEIAPIETAFVTAFMALKFTKLGPILASKLKALFLGSKVISAITGAWASLGGLGGILTMDLATVIGAGSFAEIAVTFATGLGAALLTAFAGFNIGKEIGKLIFPENKEFYDDFKWFGDGGFFDSIFGIGGDPIKFDFSISKETEKLIEPLQNLLSTIEESEGNFEITFGDTKKSIEQISGLEDAYFELANKQKLSSEEQTLLVGYAKKLIELVPELSGYIDSETGAYKGEASAIKKVISAQKKKMLNDTLIARQSEILDQIVDSTMELKKKTEQYNKAKESQATIDKEHEKTVNSLTEKTRALNSKLRELSRSENVSKIQKIKLATQIEELNKQLENENNSYKSLSVNNKAIIKEYDTLSGKTKQLKTDYDNYGKAINSTSDDIDELINIMLGIPDSKTTKIKVDKTNADNNISKTKKNLSSIPKNKTVFIDGNTKKAENALKSFEKRTNSFKVAMNLSAKIKASIDKDSLSKVKKSLSDIKVNFKVKYEEDFKTPAKAFNTLTLGNVQKYATGGLVDSGQIFIAREAGPELVGNIGGHTAVANNDQIVTALAQGIAPAVYSAVSSAIQNNASNGNSDIVVNIDGKQVFKAVQKQSEIYRKSTGNPAFSV